MFNFLYLTNSFRIITKVNKFQYKDPVNTKLPVQLWCIFLHLLKAQPRQSHSHFDIKYLIMYLYFAYYLTLTITNHIKVKH